mmetsp:Transcript_2663/g.3642  ORF Transcript_2663/g.3642 Transcript_2663/m.3642 type:complete len:167 (-) Transcript_2663:81-581(-)
MIDEIYRVMAHGSRLITFSLHPVHEVVNKYDIPSRFQWNVTCFRVKSSRWNDSKNRKRAVSHTMIICDKPIGGQFPRPLTLLKDRVPGILTEEEDAALKKIADDVLFRYALKSADIITLQHCMCNALQQIRLTNDPSFSHTETTIQQKRISNKIKKLEKKKMRNKL